MEVSPYRDDIVTVEDPSPPLGVVDRHGDDLSLPLLPRGDMEPALFADAVSSMAPHIDGKRLRVEASLIEQLFRHGLDELDGKPMEGGAVLQGVEERRNAGGLKIARHFIGLACTGIPGLHPYPEVQEGPPLAPPLLLASLKILL